MNLIDAQEMKKNYPRFEAPSWEDLNKLSVGDLIKVCVPPERFWLQIIQINDKRILARIDNDLLSTKRHGLQYGMSIEIEKRNIYKIDVL